MLQGERRNHKNHETVWANTEHAAESANWTSAEWKQHQAELANKPFLAADSQIQSEISHAFTEIERQNNVERVFERSQEAPYVEVPTKAIVQAPSLDGWENSYHQPHNIETTQRGENAVIEIGRSMSQTVKNCLNNNQIPPEKRHAAAQRSLQEICFRPDQFPVYVRKIHGPRGPIYLVQDGSHRIAAAKLIGLDSVTVRVGHLTSAEDAKKVWYESLALMTPRAREELMRVYNEVYPPTDEILETEAAELTNAETYLDEIIEEQKLHRTTLKQQAEEAAAEGEIINEQYRRAKIVETSAKNKLHFQQLRNEAALEFLKTQTDDVLWDEYMPAMDADGYLLRRDGEESYAHVTGYDIGDSYTKILIETAIRYQQAHPDEIFKD